MSWYHPRKQNWEDHLKTTRKQHPREWPWQKWATHNHQHQWQRRIQYQTALSTKQQKKSQSNIHDILLGQRQNAKKSFPHILGKGKEKPS